MESFTLPVELNEMFVLLREGFLFGLVVTSGVPVEPHEGQNQKSPHGFRYEGLEIHGRSVPYLFFIGQLRDFLQGSRQFAQ